MTATTLAHGTTVRRLAPAYLRILFGTLSIAAALPGPARAQAADQATPELSLAPPSPADLRPWSEPAVEPIDVSTVFWIDAPRRPRQAVMPAPILPYRWRAPALEVSGLIGRAPSVAFEAEILGADGARHAFDETTDLRGLLRDVRRAPPTSGAGRFTIAGEAGAFDFDAARGRLRIDMPGLDLHRTFRARDEAQALRIARRVLDRRRDDIATLALRWSAASTPDDPVAGNRGSLLTLLSQQVFAMSKGALRPYMAYVTTRFDAGPPVLMRSASQGGAAFVNRVDVPLNDRVRVTVSAPMALGGSGDGGGAPQKFSGSVNLGASLQATSAWTLGTMVHWGAAGEADRSIGALAGVSGFSRLDVPAGPAILSFVSQASSFRSLPVQYGGQRLDYDLSTVVARNGLAAALPFARPAGAGHDRFGVELTETRFIGSDLYVERSLDAGLAWRRSDALGRDTASARLSALVDDGGETGLRLELGLAF